MNVLEEFNKLYPGRVKSNRIALEFAEHIVKIARDEVIDVMATEYSWEDYEKDEVLRLMTQHEVI